MKTSNRNSRHAPHCWAALLAGSLLLPLTANAATADSGSAEANYRKERADCMSGRSIQDRQTCLKEAGAALAESRRGQLKSADAAQLQANAVERCQRVPADDRQACEAMARGEGQRSGSVAEGAVLTQFSTLSYAPPAAGLPASSTAR